MSGTTDANTPAFTAGELKLVCGVIAGTKGNENIDWDTVVYHCQTGDAKYAKRRFSELRSKYGLRPGADTAGDDGLAPTPKSTPNKVTKASKKKKQPKVLSEDAEDMIKSEVFL